MANRGRINGAINRWRAAYETGDHATAPLINITYINCLQINGHYDNPILESVYLNNFYFRNE